MGKEDGVGGEGVTNFLVCCSSVGSDRVFLHSLLLG
jgi:hypothetical protein